MFFRPFKLYLVAACLCATLVLPAVAEYHVIVTHVDMLDRKSWDMMTYEEFRAEQKRIDIERRLLEEAQKMAEAEWSDGGRYPGRILDVRQLKKGRSYFHKEDGEKSLATLKYRFHKREEQSRKQRIKKMGKEQWQRLNQAHALLKSKLSELISREESRAVLAKE